MLSEIKIKNSKSGIAVIDIEGSIGVPEEWQFEQPAGRVATYERFQRSLAALSKIKSSEVVVNIRSSGGDVGDALLIYDALVGLDATITTRCYGYVASAATIIAQAAGEGRREISANSLYLIHNSVAGCEGNARDFRQSEELLSKTDERIAAIYSGRSGHPVEEFVSLMSENNGSGRWLSPEEALAAGLCDRIIEAEPVAGKKKSKALPRASADADILRLGQNIELERLRRRITTLESANAQLSAHPTITKSKEDPSPTEGRRSANETAYQRDIENFLN